MTSPDPTTPDSAEPPRSLRSWIVEMPRWKKISLGLAGALVVTGAVMMAMGSGAQAVPAGGADGGAGSGLLETGLVPRETGGPHPTGGATHAANEPAAKGIFRLGFSFIAGFAIGSFFRATLKVASIALGFWLVMTMILSYYGLVEVNWDGIDALWQRFASNVEAEWQNFRNFITGSLPAAGLVATGFAVGIKRN